LRRRVQAGQELSIGQNGAIKQSVFSRPAGRFEHEVGEILA
jgi:hypothetical protein